MALERFRAIRVLGGWHGFWHGRRGRCSAFRQPKRRYKVGDVGKVCLAGDVVAIKHGPGPMTCDPKRDSWKLHARYRRKFYLRVGLHQAATAESSAAANRDASKPRPRRSISMQKAAGPGSLALPLARRWGSERRRPRSRGNEHSAARRTCAGSAPGLAGTGRIRRRT